MKNRDRIRQYDLALHVHFGSTGERRAVTALSLNDSVQVRLDGKRLLWSNPTQGANHECLLEEFGSEALAGNAFEAMQHALDRFTRRRVLFSRVKGAVKWGLLPALGLIFALGLNMYAARMTGITSQAAAGNPGQVNEQPVYNPGATQPGFVPPQQPQNLQNMQLGNIPGLPPAADPSIVKQAISAGTKAGKYAVQLSQGGKGTVFVFSDPSCPHCRNFEPELEKLSADYTIQLFPVSVIGGPESSTAIAQMLCAKPEDRASYWKKIVKGDRIDAATCPEGEAAVAANDQIFRKLNFLGTPTVVNTSGEQTPLTLPNTARAISQWLDQTKAQ
ncbi:thioredoxin fold domain-containing protein [Pseudomonas sp. MPC6]|uniref:DsbC family protein n=1 Tax=unclassified Pseudomonas TaxID=196821 RepID=UPI001110865B|nr:thioredoxin fold domain-containing protein [Pseudomonas sp. MPC6]QCY09375.1 DsbC family protein [Pseudomonas sp. MPC6]